ncbi:hypothetical protein V0U79_00360 [Hyphobacterium sp. HN65]|uniref:Tetratricopeptide repeat protein n=1 Tax=Hyphobacterium lacteum TaxID=3116575 RepID=A0ABU7LLN9_9PROT|nr:hypothetical protein [Hyphobacterium sp. HN65]MEE2524803.1 hypothetical protein [Hyphobacterium sp. HN65]
MGRFLHELRRRNVFRFAAGYLAVAWVTFEVISGVKNAAGLPVWADSVALIILVAAFPVILFVAWTFELTPDGIRTTRSPESGANDVPLTPRPMDYVLMAAIILFAGLLAWQPINRTIRTGAPPLARTGEEVNIVSSAETEGGAEAETDGQEPAAIPELTVAVLPFLAMSSNEDDGYFADGLTEEILNSLAAVPELRVTSRTSAFQFRGNDLPSIPEIANSLGVAHVLEGSVRRSGDQVRITAQLIRAEDDVHLWSQTYDRSLDDVFAIQEDIAENVAGVLQIVLSENNRRQMRNSGTRNIDAFIAFQQGKTLWDRGHLEDDGDALLEQADAFFTRATELAPDFSEAYLLQSDYYAHILSEYALEEEFGEDELDAARERHTELLERAHETASTDTRRAIVEANQIFFSDDWRNARGAIEDALTSQECAHDNWLQDFARVYDNLDHRLDYAERQVRCDPLNPDTRLLLGNTLLDRGDYDAALTLADELVNQGMDYESEVIRFDALLGLGRLDDAEAMLQPHWEWERIRLAAMRGGDEAETVIRPFATDETGWFDMLMHAFLGDREAANAMAAEIDARPYGFIDLMTAIDSCRCGTPFDRDAAPDFSMRYAQSGFAWPPAGDLGFPLMETTSDE